MTLEDSFIGYNHIVIQPYTILLGIRHVAAGGHGGTGAMPPKRKNRHEFAPPQDY